MLKKEISEVTKYTIFFILVALFMPALLIVTTIISGEPFFSVFFPLFQFGLLSCALFMGVSLFSGERSQKGMEYLLSLPYSRLHLIGLKILPRLSAVIIFYLIFVILYKIGDSDAAAITFIPFTAIYFTLFLLALSLSAFSDNFIILSVTSLFSLFIWNGLLYLVYWGVLKIRGIPLDELDIEGLLLLKPGLFLWLDIPKFLPLVAITLLLPFLISFVLSIKKFDVRPAKVLNKRFFKYFAPIFVCCLAISLLFAYQGTKFEYQEYYLTQDHKLIEFEYYSKIKIYEGEEVHKTEKKFEYFWPNFDEDEYVYDLWGEQIARLNTSNYKTETLYERAEKRRLNWMRWKYNNTIVFLEKNEDLSGAELVLFDIFSRKLTRVPIDYKPLVDYFNPFIFGRDKINDRQFWLIYSPRVKNHPIRRIWEDGRTEIIGKSQRRPCYINQMLITYTEEAIIISRTTEGRFETIREIPWKIDIAFSGGWRLNLQNIQSKEIYGQKYIQEKSIIARLDLETLEAEEVGEFKGYLRYSPPGNYYFVAIDKAAALINIHQLKDGKMRLIKSLPDFDTKKNDFLRFFKAGMVLKKGKKINVYAFPDLRELKFKKL
ncbi:MAG: hypothetical protein JSV96_02010 [Candidatus Aminicenantes bacterium]|nr:MAG: hypothetical protein JSV96_02010 [Candidatus Aminicenantes bacterium]